MDNIPNEVLCKIVILLDFQELKTTGLINSRLDSIVNSYLKDITTVKIGASQLQGFNNSFANCDNLPFSHFSFSESSLFSKSGDIDEFSKRFVRLVRIYRLGVPNNLGWDTQSKGALIIKNIAILLQNAENLEELSVESSYTLGSWEHELPHLPNLCRIQVSVARPRGGVDRCLNMALSKLPFLTTFSFMESNSKKVAQILHNLEKGSPNVVVALHGFYLEDSIPVEQILRSKLQFSELGFYASEHGESPATFSKFEQWMASQKLLKKLKMRVDSCNITLEPTRMESLEVLELAGESTLLPQIHLDQFLNLKVLEARSSHYHLFSCAVLKNVTKFTLHATHHQPEFDRWLRILPNVTNLVLYTYSYIAEAFQMAFGFRGLLHLSIGVDYNSTERVWKLLTGGEPKLEELLDCPTSLSGNIDSGGRTSDGSSGSLSLKNLNYLETLELPECCLEALRAIVYLTNTLQLPRLRKLSIKGHNQDMDRIQLYLSRLGLYHRKVSWSDRTMCC